MTETAEWMLYSDAVTKVSDTMELDRERADRALVGGARNGALFTRARPHHDEADPIRLEPVAWRGMDPYRALSMLCTPNPGDRVQSAFVSAPMLHRVEFHVPTLVAWLSRQPQPAPAEIRPGPKSGGEWAAKQRVAIAIKELVTKHGFDPYTHGASARAARILQNQPEFKNYAPQTLEKYARREVSLLKKKTGRISRK
jgi:hypothetical protein